MKAVYLVLEPQYQNALSQAANSLNAQNGAIGVELSGYLIEELRDPSNFADFQADVAEADVFIASLIFIEDLAQKVVDAVTPHRERLKAIVVFPSMPEVMRLNKSGIFFRELDTDGPLGSLGVPVRRESSVAVDPNFVPYGAPVFLDMEHNEADGLWIAQDTGGAIKGANRFDTFWGNGADAREIAGGMSARGSALVLLPRGTLDRLESRR